MFTVPKCLKYEIKGTDHNSILINVSSAVESSSGPQRLQNKMYRDKGKAVPLQAWTGREDSR